MHNYVYQIEHDPISEKERTTYYHLPDWFRFAISDWAEDLTGERRKAAIDSLVSHFGSSCTENADQLIFAPQVKQNYFQNNFDYFRSALSVLQEVDLNAFSGSTPAPVLHAAMRGLVESYDDDRSAYVYSDGELQTLDSWLRHTNLSPDTPLYLGGVIDYHS